MKKFDGTIYTYESHNTLLSEITLKPISTSIHDDFNKVSYLSKQKHRQGYELLCRVFFHVLDTSSGKRVTSTYVQVVLKGNLTQDMI